MESRSETITVEGTDMGTVEVEVTVYQGEIFIEVSATEHSLSIEQMELVSREFQIKLGPDWNRA